MTREEAVARIKDHIKIHRYHEQNTEKIFEALDMAIKALEQPELCEDAVSRAEVLNCLEWQYPDKLPRTKIMELPPVTPKRRTGKWIKITNTLHKCDRCGAVQLKGNYCKDCGAKMEGANDG